MDPDRQPTIVQSDDEESSDLPYHTGAANSDDDEDDDDTVEEARELLAKMSDPPADDPPMAQSTHAHADYPTSDEEEVITESEIIEEEILTDGEETIEEEIIEEYTEGSIRSKEDRIQELSTVQETTESTLEKGEIAETTGAEPAASEPRSPGTADAMASPTRTVAPKLDNDLAAFMERRRRAADGDGDESTPTGDDEKTAHMSNIKDDASHPEASSMASEPVPAPAPAPMMEEPPLVDESESDEYQPAAAAPSLFEQQRSYEDQRQQQYSYQQREPEETTYRPQEIPPPRSQMEPEEEEKQPDSGAPMVAGAAVAGAAVGAGAMYYAQQQDEPDEEEIEVEEEEMEPFDDEEGVIDEDEAPVATPVSSYVEPSPYQQPSPYQSQASPYSQPLSSPYDSQSTPYQSQPSSQPTPTPLRNRDSDLEQGDGEEKPKDEEKQSTGPSWSCFALCCCIAIILIAAGIILGVFLSDDDSDARDIIINTPPPNQRPSSPPRPTGPTAAPTMGPIRLIPMEPGREVEGLASLGFGAAIAVSSTKLAVGAPANSTGGYVYNYGERNGVFDVIGEMAGPNAGAGYGTSIDMNSLNSMIVGAPRGNPQGKGAAFFYGFQQGSGTWELQGGTILGGQYVESRDERFGEAVAISSSTVRAAVGAPGYANGTGRIYMFELTDSTWTPMDLQELVGRSATAGLGSAVDMSDDGTVVAVGSPGNNGFEIYQWSQSLNQWSRSLTETGPANSAMGTSVAMLSNRYAAVGLPLERGDRGAIRLYEKRQGLWVQADLITGEPGERIGGKGLLTGSVSGVDGANAEITFGTANGKIRRFDFISGKFGERFTINTGFTSLSSVAIDKSSDTVKVWAGSNTTGEIKEFVQVITPAPTRALTTQPTTAPTSRPTVTFAPTTETKFPTTKPTSNPTGIPVGSGWVEYQTFSAPGGYGSSVALDDDGTVMVTGSPAFNNGMGAVQTFRKVGKSWESMSTIYDDEALGFGEAVDISVATGWTSVVVGAPETTNSQYTDLNFGSVHYLEIVNMQWAAVGDAIRPEATTFSAGGAFGAAVAVAAANRRIAVGAPRTTLDANNVRNGRVFTYEYNGNAWVQLAPPIDGDEPGILLGSAIAMTEDGTRLLVGAPGSSGAGGRVYYYALRNATWQMLLPLPGDAGENLGASVAIIAADGETIAMGAPGFNGGRGAVRVYRRPNPANEYWEKVGNDIVGDSGEALGTTLSGANGRVIVGTNTGKFKVYRFFNNTWTLEGEPQETGSPVVSIAASSEKEVVVGMGNEEVAFWGLF